MPRCALFQVHEEHFEYHLDRIEERGRVDTKVTLNKTRATLKPSSHEDSTCVIIRNLKMSAD